MMNKKLTYHRSMWNYTLILPVITILLIFNCAFQTKAEMSNKMQDTIQTLVNEQIIVIKDFQQENKGLPDIKKKQAKSDNKPPIFSHVEQMPQFPGGEDELMKWLSENTIYPPIAQEQGIQGRVTMRFIVTPDGSIDEVQVIKSLDPACDKEAVRVIKSMPKWIPGKQNGNPVYVYYNIPVLFKLSGEDNSAKPASVIQYNKDVIIEIDGNVVSEEELKKLDPKEIDSFSFVKSFHPNRLIIKTKKRE